MHVITKEQLKDLAWLVKTEMGTVQDLQAILKEMDALELKNILSWLEPHETSFLQEHFKILLQKDWELSDEVKLFTYLLDTLSLVRDQRIGKLPAVLQPLGSALAGWRRKWSPNSPEYQRLHNEFKVLLHKNEASLRGLTLALATWRTRILYANRVSDGLSGFQELAESVIYLETYDYEMRPRITARIAEARGFLEQMTRLRQSLPHLESLFASATRDGKPMIEGALKALSWTHPV
jgi:hypothetical protein